MRSSEMASTLWFCRVYQSLWVRNWAFIVASKQFACANVCAKGVHRRRNWHRKSSVRRKEHFHLAITWNICWMFRLRNCWFLHDAAYSRWKTNISYAFYLCIRLRYRKRKHRKQCFFIDFRLINNTFSLEMWSHTRLVCLSIQSPNLYSLKNITEMRRPISKKQ